LRKSVELVSGVFPWVFGGVGDFKAIGSFFFRNEVGREMVLLGSGFQCRFLSVGVDQPKLKFLYVGIPIGYLFDCAIGKFTVIDFYLLTLSCFALAASLYI